jgi:hypothetical protein
MRGRIIAIVVGLAISAAGFYLVIKWWDGNAWQRFLSGAMALGGLGAAWEGVKGPSKKTAEPPKASNEQDKTPKP